MRLVLALGRERSPLYRCYLWVEVEAEAVSWWRRYWNYHWWKHLQTETVIGGAQEEENQLTGVIVTRRRTGAPARPTEHLVQGGLDEPSQTGSTSSRGSSCSCSSRDSWRSLGLVSSQGVRAASSLGTGGITSLAKLLSTNWKQREREKIKARRDGLSESLTWTCSVKLQPGNDAAFVETMIALQQLDFLPLGEILPTHRT